MPDEPPPIDDDSEDLVAYLDGELNDHEARAVESKLASDDATRKKIESLKKTYDLLDYLPKPEPSPTFASRTLTQVNLSTPAASNPASTSHPALHPHPPTPRAYGITIWSVTLICAFVFGYLGNFLARPHLEAGFPNKRTSEQVRLLERLPLLLGVDDIEFAKQLDTPELFGNTESDESPPRSPSETLTSTELEQLENLFKTYPPARQQQLRNLDDEIARLDPSRQNQLLESLERYAIWLDRLPDSYRKEVLSAPASIERLETIRVIRLRQWREGLPASIRDRIQNADGPQRDQLLSDARHQDSRRRSMWEIAKREWANIRTDRKPWPFDNDAMTVQVNDYVENSLRPRLSNFERVELDSLRRELNTSNDWFKWYLYGHTLCRLVDQHPMLPEPASGKLIKSVADLPQDFLTELRKKSGTGRRQLVQHPSSGKWPDFAEVVVREAMELKVQLPAGRMFGPTKPEEYQTEIRRFLENDLAKSSSLAELAELKKLEQSPWPEHSKKLMELARKHDLAVPGVTLPGPPSQWDSVYRNRPGKK